MDKWKPISLSFPTSFHDFQRVCSWAGQASSRAGGISPASFHKEVSPHKSIGRAAPISEVLRGGIGQVDLIAELYCFPPATGGATGIRAAKQATRHYLDWRPLIGRSVRLLICKPLYDESA